MDAAAAPNSPTDEAAALLVAGLLTIAELHGCSASEVHWICWNSSTHVTKMKCMLCKKKERTQLDFQILFQICINVMYQNYHTFSK